MASLRQGCRLASLRQGCRQEAAAAQLRVFSCHDVMPCSMHHRQGSHPLAEHSGIACNAEHRGRMHTSVDDGTQD